MNTKNSKENLALKLAKDNIEVEQVKPLQDIFTFFFIFLY